MGLEEFKRHVCELANLNAIIALAALLVLAQPVVVLLAVLPVAGLKPAALPVALPTSLYLRFPVQMQAV